MNEWATFTKDVVTTAAAVAGLILAYIGLSTWRRQILGNKRFDLAFETLQKCRVLVEMVREFRRPFVGAGEMAAAHKKKHKKPLDIMNREMMNKANLYVMEQRWNRALEAYTDYAHALLKLEILLNVSDLELVNGRRIRHLMFEIIDAYEENIYYKSLISPDTSPEDRTEYIQKQRETGNIAYAHNNDPTDLELDAFFTALNAKLRPYID